MNFHKEMCCGSSIFLKKSSISTPNSTSESPVFLQIRTKFRGFGTYPFLSVPRNNSSPQVSAAYYSPPSCRRLLVGGVAPPQNRRPEKKSRPLFAVLLAIREGQIWDKDQKIWHFWRRRTVELFQRNFTKRWSFER